MSKNYRITIDDESSEGFFDIPLTQEEHKIVALVLEMISVNSRTECSIKESGQQELDSSKAVEERRQEQVRQYHQKMKEMLDKMTEEEREAWHKKRQDERKALHDVLEDGIAGIFARASTEQRKKWYKELYK